MKDQWKSIRKTLDISMEEFPHHIRQLAGALSTSGKSLKKCEILNYITNLLLQDSKSFDKEYSLLITQDLQLQRFNNLSPTELEFYARVRKFIKITILILLVLPATNIKTEAQMVTKEDTKEEGVLLQ